MSLHYKIIYDYSIIVHGVRLKGGCVVMFNACVSLCVCGPPHPPGRGLSPLWLCHEHQVLPDKSRPRGPLP